MTKSALIVIFGGFFLIFLIYFGSRVQNVLQGPLIRIAVPEEGDFLTNTHNLVWGEGREVTNLELNGRPIYTDENGFFEEELILAPGLNIIELTADGRFGRELVRQKTVMVRLPE